MTEIKFTIDQVHEACYLTTQRRDTVEAFKKELTKNPIQKYFTSVKVENCLHKFFNAKTVQKILTNLRKET